jgi:hypothetical protein
MIAAVASPAGAETYRCTMDRQVSVKGFGNVEDDKDYNKGTEFYFAIDRTKERGTYSTCRAPAPCSTVGDVWAVQRWEAKGINGNMNRSIRFITGASGQIGMMWNLEQWLGEKDFTAIAVFAIAQRSDTWFGICKKVIE